MLFWNQKELRQPPINTCKSSTQDLDLAKLRNALQDGIKHFKDHEFLSIEAALLSRILYRMKLKFRTHKDIKLMEKLSRSLGNYFNSNMERHLKNILDMIPITYYEKDNYLPTKNMMSFILVKLQGLVKLMERIYDTCLLAASELNARFYIGHFWKVFLIMFALVSRISILVKFNTKFLCELYGKLLPHSHKLQNTGKNWLPDGYVLPPDLRTWLSVQWVYEEEFVDLTFDRGDGIINFFDLVDDDGDDDDVLFCDEYILLDDEDKNIVNDFHQLSPIKERLTRNRMRGFSINEDDIGEHVTELNDIGSGLNGIEENPEPAVNSLNKSYIEDIGEEISVTFPSSTAGYPGNNKAITSIKKRHDIISIPDTPIRERNYVNNSTVIVLDDDGNNENTVSKKATKRKKKAKKAKKSDVLHLSGSPVGAKSIKIMKRELNTLSHLSRSPAEAESVKIMQGELSRLSRLKKMKETVAQPDGTVLKSPTKIDKTTRINKANITPNEFKPNTSPQDVNIDSNIILLDQDMSSGVTLESRFLDKDTLELNEAQSGSPAEVRSIKKWRKELKPSHLFGSPAGAKSIKIMKRALNKLSHFSGSPAEAESVKKMQRELSSISGPSWSPALSTNIDNKSDVLAKRELELDIDISNKKMKRKQEALPQPDGTVLKSPSKINKSTRINKANVTPSEFKPSTSQDVSSSVSLESRKTHLFLDKDTLELNEAQSVSPAEARSIAKRKTRLNTLPHLYGCSPAEAKKSLEIMKRELEKLSLLSGSPAEAMSIETMEEELKKLPHVSGSLAEAKSIKIMKSELKELSHLSDSPAAAMSIETMEEELEKLPHLSGSAAEAKAINRIRKESKELSLLLESPADTQNNIMKKKEKLEKFQKKRMDERQKIIAYLSAKFPNKNLSDNKDAILVHEDVPLPNTIAGVSQEEVLEPNETIPANKANRKIPTRMEKRHDNKIVKDLELGEENLLKESSSNEESMIFINEDESFAKATPAPDALKTVFQKGGSTLTGHVSGLPAEAQSVKKMKRKLSRISRPSWSPALSTNIDNKSDVLTKRELELDIDITNKKMKRKKEALPQPDGTVLKSPSKINKSTRINKANVTPSEFKPSTSRQNFNIDSSIILLGQGVSSGVSLESRKTHLFLDKGTLELNETQSVSPAVARSIDKRKIELNALPPLPDSAAAAKSIEILKRELKQLSLFFGSPAEAMSIETMEEELKKLPHVVGSLAEAKPIKIMKIELEELSHISDSPAAAMSIETMEEELEKLPHLSGSAGIKKMKLELKDYTNNIRKELKELNLLFESPAEKKKKKKPEKLQKQMDKKEQIIEHLPAKFPNKGLSDDKGAILIHEAVSLPKNIAGVSQEDALESNETIPDNKKIKAVELGEENLLKKSSSNDESIIIFIDEDKSFSKTTPAPDALKTFSRKGGSKLTGHVSDLPEGVKPIKKMKKKIKKVKKKLSDEPEKLQEQMDTKEKNMEDLPAKFPNKDLSDDKGTIILAQEDVSFPKNITGVSQEAVLEPNETIPANKANRKRSRKMEKRHDNKKVKAVELGEEDLLKESSSNDESIIFIDEDESFAKATPAPAALKTFSQKGGSKLPKRVKPIKKMKEKIKKIKKKLNNAEPKKLKKKMDKMEKKIEGLPAKFPNKDLSDDKGTKIAQEDVSFPKNLAGVSQEEDLEPNETSPTNKANDNKKGKAVKLGEENLLKKISSNDESIIFIDQDVSFSKAIPAPAALKTFAQRGGSKLTSHVSHLPKRVKPIKKMKKKIRKIKKK